MILKSNQTNNLHFKNYLNSLLPKLGKEVVVERLGDCYFLVKEYWMFFEYGLIQFTHNFGKKLMLIFCGNKHVNKQ